MCNTPLGPDMSAKPASNSPTYQKSYQSFGTLGQLLKIPHFVQPKIALCGPRGVSNNFLEWNPNIYVNYECRNKGSARTWLGPKRVNKMLLILATAQVQRGRVASDFTLTPSLTKYWVQQSVNRQTTEKWDQTSIKQMQHPAAFFDRLAQLWLQTDKLLFLE